METPKKRTGTAFVTGATSGIGKELARCCAADGYDLVLLGRDPGALAATAGEFISAYNIAARTICADLTDVREAFRAYDELKQTGIPDLFINNAGQGVYGLFTETDLQEELGIITLNISSFTVLTKLVLKDMVARNSGRILHLASVASKSSTPYMAVYGATKAYIYNFTQALISELDGTSEVTLTALLPGPTDTDFFREAGAENMVAVQEGQLADPADVAKEGYAALQGGKSKVIAGWMNKVQAAAGNLMTDEMLADMAKAQNEESDETPSQHKP